MPGSADLMEGLAALEAHAADYLRADQYATGALPERFANDRIRQVLAGSALHYRFRLAGKPITALTNRVGVSSVTSARGEAVNAVIGRLRESTDAENQDPVFIERLARHGDAYRFVWPTDDGVEITHHSPLHCRAIYDSDDGKVMRYVIRRWSESSAAGTVWRAEVWYPGRMEAWICQPGANGQDQNQWEPYDPDGDGWPVAHDAGRIPFVHARTDFPYGRPVHIDAYGPQDAVTKAIIMQVVNDLEAHGWPERARLTDDKALLDAARDTVNWGDDKDAPSADQQVSGRRRGPGHEQIYTGTKSVIQFAPPDPGILIPVIDQWVRLMAVATDTPVWEFDPSTGQQLSGVARWRAEKPLRDKEARFKRFLLQAMRETYALALHWQGIDGGVIDVEWTPPEVQADPEWWAAADIRHRYGVPVSQILTEAGYRPDEIRDFLTPDEGDDMRFLSERVQLMKDLAESLSALSGPVSLGILDAAKVSALVDRIMVDAGESAIGGDPVDVSADSPTGE